MPTRQKVATVKDLTDRLGRAQLTIIADYRGLSVGDLQGLRGDLRPTGAEFHIAKNTLTTIAAKEAGIDGFEGLLAGPTALVLAYDDPVQTSKVIVDFVRSSRVLNVRGGVMNNQFISEPEISTLATLPSREELQGKLVGLLASPMARTVGVLSGPIRSLPYVLNARAAHLGVGADAPDAEAAD